MTKILSFLTALLMFVGNVSADTASHSMTLSFDANSTTGYEWTAFILGGDSAQIDMEHSGYVSDAAPDDNRTGVGGKHYFQLNAIKPGDTIIRFTYARSWENDAIEQIMMLVTVDENLNIYTTDVTESGVYEGVVTAVNTEDHSVTMTSERLGEVIARFDEDEALPVVDEQIVIYTNGTMTMSLPAIVNVIAWGSIPGELAK